MLITFQISRFSWNHREITNKESVCLYHNSLRYTWMNHPSRIDGVVQCVHSDTKDSAGVPHWVHNDTKESAGVVHCVHSNIKDSAVEWFKLCSFRFKRFCWSGSLCTFSRKDFADVVHCLYSENKHSAGVVYCVHSNMKDSVGVTKFYCVHSDTKDSVGVNHCVH